MTTWQAQRLTIDRQSGPVSVVSSLGTFTGLTSGVRFDARQRRQCLRLWRDGHRLDVPVSTIERIEPLAAP